MTACRIDAYDYRLSPNCSALSSSACMLRCFEFCLDLYSVIQESCSKSDTFSAGASVMCLWLMHIELTISQHESSVRGHHSAHAYSSIHSHGVKRKEKRKRKRKKISQSTYGRLGLLFKTSTCNMLASCSLREMFLLPPHT